MRSGKFVEQIVLMGQWIQDRKFFIWFGNDYVVVSMSYERYIELFGGNRSKIEYKFLDEAAPVDPAVFEQLSTRLKINP